MQIRVTPRTPFGEWILESRRTVMSVRDEVRLIPGQERFADKTVRAAIRGPVGRDAASVLAQVSGLSDVAILAGRHVVDIDGLNEPERIKVIESVREMLNAVTSCPAG